VWHVGRPFQAVCRQEDGLEWPSYIKP